MPIVLRHVATWASINRSMNLALGCRQCTTKTFGTLTLYRHLFIVSRVSHCLHRMIYITHLRAFLRFTTCFVLADEKTLVLESSENCDLVVLAVRTNADECSRYSNTLFVSLNNRIYFRDYPYPGGRGDTWSYVDSGRSHPSTVSSVTFAHPGLHFHTASIGNSLRLGIVPSTKVIDIGKSAIIEESLDARCVLPSQDFVQAVQRLRIPFVHDNDSAPT